MYLHKHIYKLLQCSKARQQPPASSLGSRPSSAAPGKKTSNQQWPMLLNGIYLGLKVVPMSVLLGLCMHYIGFCSLGEQQGPSLEVARG